MMKCLLLLCIALSGWTARAADSDSLHQHIYQNINSGEYFTVVAQTLTPNISSCYIITPTEQKIQLVPESDVPGRIELQNPNHLFGCSVIVREANSDDNGEWKIVATTQDGDDITGTAVVSVLSDDLELRADSPLISAVEGDSVTMSCSINSPILYCYFRFRNGTVFNAGDSGGGNSVEYVGAGFDKGECAIRFASLSPGDSGEWSCHVGFASEQLEHRASFHVAVQEKMSVEQTILHGNVLSIETRVHDGSPITYCRFVRMDGFGFSTYHIPISHYAINYDLMRIGICQLRIPNASILEHHPWVVAVKLESETFEIVRQTTHTLTIPDASTPAPPADSPPAESPPAASSPHYGFKYFWIIFISIMMIILIVGILMVPKKNRMWTQSRMTMMRTSFRDSFNKKAAPGPETNNTTSMTA